MRREKIKYFRRVASLTLPPTLVLTAERTGSVFVGMIVANAPGVMHRDARRDAEPHKAL